MAGRTRVLLSYFDARDHAPERRLSRPLQQLGYSIHLDGPDLVIRRVQRCRAYVRVFASLHAPGSTSAAIPALMMSPITNGASPRASASPALKCMLTASQVTPQT